jgi:hypothetical protein
MTLQCATPAAAAAFELLADETLDFFTNTPKKVGGLGSCP